MTDANDEPAGLGAAGLDADEVAAYELIITQPESTLAELAKAWTRSVPLNATMDALAAKGFVTRDGDAESSYTAVDPEIAMETSLDEYDAKLRRARKHVRQLASSYRARSVTGNGGALVEVVTGHQAVVQRLIQLLHGARHEMRCLDKPPYIDSPRAAAFDLELLQRGVACRTIYERASVEQPGSFGDVEQMLAAGQLARVLPSLPMKLYLADRRCALLPLQLEPASAEAAVVVHPCALLDALRKLFDGLWDRALPLQHTDDTAVATTSGRRANLDQSQLVTLLLSGLTDETIARQLGIGYRTVQRHVAALMTKLGAHTRFQAGLQTALLHRDTPAG